MPSALALRPEVLALDLAGDSRTEVFAEVAARLAKELAAGGLVVEPGLVERRLEEREALGSTALGGGFAIPHCKLEGLKGPWVLAGRCPARLDFGAPDGRPVSLLFFVFSPAADPVVHLKTLAALARWAHGPGNVEGLGEHLDPMELGRIFEG